MNGEQLSGTAARERESSGRVRRLGRMSDGVAEAVGSSSGVVSISSIGGGNGHSVLRGSDGVVDRGTPL